MADPKKNNGGKKSTESTNATTGAKASTGNGPKLPVTSSPSSSKEGAPARVSPAAIASLVGTSLKNLAGGKKLPKIPGMAKLGGGGRGDGTKPLLLAVFFIKYADWTDFCRHVANNTINIVYVDGAERTKENRVMLIVDATQNIVATIAWSDIPTWFKENHNFDSVLCTEATKTCNVGAYTLPAGFAAFPAHDVVKAEDRTGLFRKNADLSEWYKKLADETADEKQKEEYLATAEYFGKANKYGGFCCATAENALTVATNVRNFYAMNPEFTNEFVELENWTSVYGQAEMTDMANAHWPNTAEYAREQAAAPAAEPAAAGSTEVANA